MLSRRGTARVITPTDRPVLIPCSTPAPPQFVETSREFDVTSFFIFIITVIVIVNIVILILIVIIRQLYATGRRCIFFTRNRVREVQTVLKKKKEKTDAKLIELSEEEEKEEKEEKKKKAATLLRDSDTTGVCSETYYVM